MSPGFTEPVVEDAALAWLEAIGWTVANGAHIAPGKLLTERTSYGDVALERRLCDALARLNPELPADALDDAFRKLTRAEAAELIVQNRASISASLRRQKPASSANRAVSSPLSSPFTSTSNVETCPISSCNNVGGNGKGP